MTGGVFGMVREQKKDDGNWKWTLGGLELKIDEACASHVILSG